MNTENWKPAVGWEDLYEVSDHGRIRSLGRTVVAGNRTWTNAPRVMSPGKDSNGRTQVKLSRAGKCQAKLVHRMVLEAFVGPAPEGAEACHNDGDCRNNSLSNLRWDTRSANQLDRRRHGTRKFGEDCHWAKYPNSLIAEIRADSRGNKELGEALGINPDYVRQIRARHARALEDVAQNTL